MPNTVLKLDPKDNVLIALRDLHRGDRIAFADREYVLASDVPAEHKFATEDIVSGGSVFMYGVLIGKAREPIRAGEVLTTRNTRHEASPFHENSHLYPWKAPDVSRWAEQTFLGYSRPDGQVGTRNHWLVVPLVFCENRNIDVLKQAFEEELGFAPPKIYRQQVAELVSRYRKGELREGETHSADEVGVQRPRHSKVFDNIDGIKFLRVVVAARARMQTTCADCLRDIFIIRMLRARRF